MAHFAKVGSDNIVLEVHAVDNWNVVDGEGHEVEAAGIAWQEKVFGVQAGITWVQTSYNHTIRKNYAGIGYTWDAGRNAFYAPKPYPSWVLDEETCLWNAPVAMPDDGKMYRWNEETVNWIEVQTSQGE